MLKDLTGVILDDRYEIQALRGSGSMAHVFTAYDHALKRQVAIKITKPEHALSPENIDDLIREAHISANLKHSHIVSVYDQGVQIIDDHKLVFFVMHCAVSGTLADRIQAGSITLDEAERILKQVCDALDYAHNQNVIHLDLKPQNILFDEQNDVLVADFGLATLLQAASHVKGQTGTGTPAYMPPEQFMGSEVGPFSDVYALAMTLYQMLTCEVPKREWTKEGLIVHLKHPLPPNISAVIEQATQHDPHRRYHTAGDLARDFTRALHTTSRQAQPLRNSLDLLELHTQSAPQWADQLAPVFPPSKGDQRNHQETRTSRRWLLSLVGDSLLLLAASVMLILFGPRARGEKSSDATSTAIALVSISSASPTSGVRPTDTTTPTATAVPATSTATATQFPAPNATPTATMTLLPTPYARIVADQSTVRTGPGERYQVLGEVRRGYQMPLRGCSEDEKWWQVDYLGWAGWIPAQPGGSSIDPDDLPVVPTPPPSLFTPVSPTPTMTSTPIATPTPTAETTPELANPGFAGIRDNQIPGWSWWAYDNYSSSEDYNPDHSFETPLLKQADDSRRLINGPTLQIDAAGYLKFQVHVFQTVNVAPNTRLRFQVSAGAYTDKETIKLVAGIDPNGVAGCSYAQWGDVLMINQADGVVKLVTPEVVVGPAGRVVVCLFAETLSPNVNNAAFIDNAQVIMITE